MATINLTPEVRFPEFTENWKESKFENHFEFKNTNSFSRDKLNYENGEVLNIHYGDIHTKFKTHFNVEKEEVPFINQDIDISRVDYENYVQKGDLIMADASENYADIGKTIEVTNASNKKILAGLHTFLARKTDITLAEGFFGHLLTNRNIRIKLMRIAQGAKVLGLSKGRVNKIPLFIPKPSEQQKIADFLSSVDQRIALLKAQKVALADYKKGVMQKIFNQEIRFKDDNGNDFPDWEEKNGNDVFESVSDKNHNSDLPILAITQDKGAIPRELIDYNIGVSSKSIQSYKIVNIGDFIISLRSFQGGIEYSNYKGICSPAYIILKPFIPINDLFYKNYLKTPKYIVELNRKLEGIRDGKMISYKYFSEIKIPYPTLSEQTKIANFLSSIDDKIAQVTSSIVQNEQYKKGLLQKMFV